VHIFDAGAAVTDAASLVVDTLVVDIEGAEVNLLPAVDLRPIRAIVLEVHLETVGPGRTSRLRRFPRQSGFREILICGGNVILHRRRPGQSRHA
jgi:hypothetical protein